jgi:hypothetical protein
MVPSWQAQTARDAGREQASRGVIHRGVREGGSTMTGDLAARAVTGGLGRGPRGQLTALWSGTDECSIPRCNGQIDPSRLMCRAHWYMVPKELRDHVWATWRSGQGAFSQEHLDAVRTAVAAVPDVAAGQAG